MSSKLTLVSATRDVVRIELVRQEDDLHTTVLGAWTFQRLTADISLEWTVDGRKALSLSDRLVFAAHAIRMTRRIVEF